MLHIYRMIWVLCMKLYLTISFGLLVQSELQGDTGYPGPFGRPGYNGYTGFTGPSGQTGSTGMQGMIGPRGYVGERGSVGAQGYVGRPGVAGLQGNRGATGRVGADGLIGPPGLEGRVGYGGGMGSTGFHGARGSSGQPGPYGPTGSTGSSGLRGPPGPVGPVGAHGGPAGSTGAQGYTGSIGPVGGQGYTGIPGPLGIIGRHGQQGPRGQPGPKGQSGPAAANATVVGIDLTTLVVIMCVVIIIISISLVIIIIFVFYMRHQLFVLRTTVLYLKCREIASSRSVSSCSTITGSAAKVTPHIIYQQLSHDSGLDEEHQYTHLSDGFGHYQHLSNRRERLPHSYGSLPPVSTYNSNRDNPPHHDNSQSLSSSADNIGPSTSRLTTTGLAGWTKDEETATYQHIPITPSDGEDEVPDSPMSITREASTVRHRSSVLDVFLDDPETLRDGAAARALNSAKSTVNTGCKNSDISANCGESVSRPTIDNGSNQTCNNESSPYLELQSS